jgi:tetratricopeptide (TPR) repeat protein
MARPTAALLVQQGYAAQQRGDLAAAQAAFEQALALDADQPDALQLLGLLARRRGDDDGAEVLWRRSLAAREAQPHVWNNLANLLDRRGRGAEALQALQRAIALDPGYADALYNLARILHREGRGAEAAEPLARALGSGRGPRAAMLQLAAQLQSDAGLLHEALQTLDQALALAPERAALHHNRGVVLQRLHRHAQALQCHQRALALGLDAAEGPYNLAVTLQSLGRPHDALPALEQALKRQPLHALALYDLARLRWRLGDADWLAPLREAAAAHPASPLPPRLLGQLLWRAERHAEAAAAFREAQRRGAADPGTLDGLARSLVRSGELDEGLALHRRAVELAPADAELRSNHAASLLVAGRPAEALAEAEAACTAAPLHQHAQALRTLALRLLGDPRAEALDDAANLVHVVDLPPPDGWADMASFNAALASELTRLHADRREPVDQTLRGGTQTFGDLFEQGHALVDALEQRIAEAVTAHVATLPTDAAHPFLARRPADPAAWRFTDSWSSRLARQGYHTDHVHPHGWLSSAYYVALPPAVADPARREGWIRFGVPDLPLPGVEPAALARRTVQPRVGRLVLFPSMMFHGTTPFDDEAPRLTIAFDVVPT